MKKLFCLLMIAGVSSLYLVPETDQPVSRNASVTFEAHSAAPDKLPHPALSRLEPQNAEEYYAMAAPAVSRDMSEARRPAGRRPATASEIHFVDFGADWCAPCKELDPLINRLMQRYGSRVIFAKVDVDKHANLAMEFGVRGVPTVLIFRDGFEAARLEGLDQAVNAEAALKSMF